MTCAQLEILLCDYVDGALAPAEKLAVEQHLATCAPCAEMARDGASAIDFMERVAEVEPPPELVTRLFHLPGLEPARPQARGGFRGWLQSLKQPMLQPRMAMGLTLTVLFFGMMARCAGMPERHLTSADLDPARVLGTLEDRANRTWQRSLKFYESIRLVYKIQTQLRDWKEQQDADAAADPNTDDRRLPAPANKQAQPAEAKP
ncbi:MAG: zf-HC2 domain-containing protein [Candidatus Solibacter usitatus]|nr:zf-HC2 domain-containing protein [Candidatus Solibacter usitatus]